MVPRRESIRLRDEDIDSQTVSRLAQQDTVPWYRKQNLRLLYLWMFVACIGPEITNGYVTSLVNGLQAVPSWLEYYNRPHSVSLGLVASMYSLGSLAATPFTPFVVDTLGRRFPILLGGIISITGSILQGSSLNLTMFIVARFVLGFANIFSIVAASTLIGGAITAASVTLATFAMNSNWGWRIPSFLQMVPSLFQIYSVWFIPESPRWLIFMGRDGEALDILVKYHAEGNENSDFAQTEYAQIKEALEGSRKISGVTWMSMISMAGMRKRIVIAAFLGLCANWCGAGLIAYYLALILEKIGIHDDRTKNIVNLAYTVSKLTFGILVVLIAAQYPRRTMYLACTVSLFIVFIAFTAASRDYSLTGNKFSAEVVIAIVFLFPPAYNLALGSLGYTYMIELFPFHVRASGMTLRQWWIQIGSFSTQLMNPIGIDNLGWRWYIAYCIWNGFQIVFVYTMFPETSGRTLEELALYKYVFEEDREILEDGSSQLLWGHGGIGTYGAIEVGR